MKPRLTLSDYYEGIISGNPVILAQAITLAESTRSEDQQLANTLLGKLLPRTGHSVRVGITGVPGVGKSTFIEALGKHLISKMMKVAVLTVDPSSQVTKGSILGDKTRMEELSKNAMAFVRPSSSGTAIGGVTYHTREAILLCEAAGYDTILIETVGVGQSEVAVKNMVDFFLLLMLPGAGDELQGLKKGIIEMADALVITKTDDENINKAKEAQAEYQQALHLLHPSSAFWKVNVMTCSALKNEGIDAVWKMIEGYIEKAKEANHFDTTRTQQNIQWMHDYFNHLMLQNFSGKDHLAKVNELEAKVRRNEMYAGDAARILAGTYLATLRSDA